MRKGADYFSFFYDLMTNCSYMTQHDHELEYHDRSHNISISLLGLAARTVVCSDTI